MGIEVALRYTTVSATGVLKESKQAACLPLQNEYTGISKAVNRPYIGAGWDQVFIYLSCSRSFVAYRAMDNSPDNTVSVHVQVRISKTVI